MFDLDHYLVHSRRWLIDYGLSEENLVGRSHYEVFSELPERWKELHQRSLAGSIEKRKVYKWFGTSTDIHDIKESEKSLLEKERLLVDSQAIAHIGSLMVDINTRTIRWSEEIFRLYGLSSLTDNPPTLDQFFELLHPDDILRMQKCTNASVSGKQPNALEFRTHPINANSRWLLGNGILETDSNGNPLRIIGTVQDITERKKPKRLFTSSLITIH